MFFLLFILIGIAAALLRGGTFANLITMPLRLGLLIILSFLIQVIVFASPFKNLSFAPELIAPLHLFSILLLVVVVLVNHTLGGMKILGLGLFLNFLVISLNGGFMPSSAEKLESAGLVEQAEILRNGSPSSNLAAIGEDTKLAFLGDVYVIPPPLPFHNVFSVGDVLIGLGAMRFVYKGMFYRRSYTFRTG